MPASRSTSTARRTGYVLIISYLVTTALTVWTFVSFQRSLIELRAADRFSLGGQAFQMAESGIDRGLRWMNTQPSPPSGIQAFDPFGGQICADAECSASYQVTIDPDDNNPTSYFDTYVIRAVGQTNRIPVSRQVELVVRTESFSQFAYFTHVETTTSGAPVWFISSDYVDGRVHTNGRLNISGTPTFDGPVASAATSINYKNGGAPVDQPKFNGGLNLGAKEIQLPTTVSPLRVAAASSGLWLEGNTTITLMDDGTIEVTNAAAGWSQQTMPVPPNGAVFVNQGNVSVSGTLKGQLTVGTSNDVILTGDTVYNSDPTNDPDSTDLLGLVAEKNIVVSKNAPNNMNVDAVMMALNESIYVEQWWTGPPKGVFKVVGGLVQYRRGPVGTFGKTGKLSGYNKQYIYDERLTNMSPPFFPTTTEYDETLWRED
jgi:hypothetical protein